MKGEPLTILIWEPIPRPALKAAPCQETALTRPELVTFAPME